MHEPSCVRDAQGRWVRPRTLILTVGLPRSGKSTWARTQGVPIVNPDAIRLALHGQRYAAVAEPFVWAVTKTMVRALFGAGHETVILDATNTTHKRRDEWQSSEWTVAYHVFDTPKDVCLARARAEGDEYIIPVIERQAAQFEPV
jgi:predicted kinase